MDSCSSAAVADSHMTQTPRAEAILSQRRMKAGMLSCPLKIFTALKVWTQFSSECGTSLAGMGARPRGLSCVISGMVLLMRSAFLYLTRRLVAGTYWLQKFKGRTMRVSPQTVPGAGASLHRLQRRPSTQSTGRHCCGKWPLEA